MTVLGAAAAGALLVVIAAGRLRPRARRAGAAPATPLHSSIGRVAAALTTRRRAVHRPSPLDVATWCDDLARHVRSGTTIRDALTTVTSIDRSTRAATASIRLGLERGRSVTEAIDGCPDAGPHLHLALRVIRTVTRLGGASPIAIDRTAGVLRQRAADDAERRVHAAQARLSAHVLTAVPLLMLALLLATDPDVRAMVGSSVGATCVAAGLTLNAAGWVWMRHVVRAEP